MTALSHPRRASDVSPSARLFAELHRRQPHLAAVSGLFLLATLPLLLALLIDTRTLNDISVWVKPIKFLVSLALYYATLAWFCAYLPQHVLHSRAGRFTIYVPIVVGAMEMVWLIAAAMHGVPSHFNPDPPWTIAYRAAGIGATVLVLAVLVQGVLIARHRDVPVTPALRLAVVLGAVIAFTGTMAFAGYMARFNAHWVGGAASDAGGMPLLGWSRSGGDLRVAHFWATHASQLLPLFAWTLVRVRPRLALPGTIVGALAYSSLVLFTFVQALDGRPFLAWLG